MLPIVTAPNPVLGTIAKPVEKVDDAVRMLVEQMKETLVATKDPEGVGLAAPQVGKSLRIFIMKPTLKSGITVIINPTIETKTAIVRPKPETEENTDTKEHMKLEGCLSLPAIWGVVERSEKVTLSYLDENGRQRKKTFAGFPAIITQHEIDHLDGILFPRRVIEQHHKLYKSSKNKKGEDVFKEITL